MDITIQNNIIPGKFIAFEGIDGSGKSTQLRLLFNQLKKDNIPCLATKEPTDSPIGSLIRRYLVGTYKTDHRALAPLFVADRLDHLLNETNGICKLIQEGTTVLTDRYYFSSYAYHGVDLPMEYVISENIPCAELLRPTVTLFIDVTPEVAMERINRNREQTELFETMERLSRVRENFFKVFTRLKDDENIRIIDGNRTEEQIASEIQDIARSLYIESK